MPRTVSDLLADGSALLRAASVPDAASDARLLLCAATGLSRLDLLNRPNDVAAADAAARFVSMIERRAAREPVSRILGRREFRSLEFEITPDTLDPRPDSETVVETALDLVGDVAGGPRLLDIGTGTGCLLLSLLHALPAATGVGTDISPGACAVAKRNAASLGLGARARFVVCEWAEPVAGRFDLIVSNPPYIASAELADLAPEVALHDPPGALLGGADGLDAFRAIAAGAKPLLTPDAAIVLEIGYRQAEDVSELFLNAGYRLVDSRKDLGRRLRSLAFRA